MPSLKSVLSGLALLALSPFMVVAVAGLSGIGHRWVDILAQFVAPALIASVVLTLLFGLLRLQYAAIAGLVVTGVLILAVWPQWVVPQAKSRADAPTITLYSANVWVGNDDVAAIRSSIQAARPDIVILVELGERPYDELETILAGYPFQVTSQPEDQRDGSPRTVIASRYRLIDRIESPPGLSAIGTVAVTPVGRIDLIATHLTRPWPYQFQYGQIIQTEKLTAMQRAMRSDPENAVIVAGDFNSISSARIGRQVKADMALIPAPGFPGSWPSALPSPLGITIDQVWHSRGLVLVDRRIGQPNGSDHRPVVTRFRRALDI